MGVRDGEWRQGCPMGAGLARQGARAPEAAEPARIRRRGGWRLAAAEVILPGPLSHQERRCRGLGHFIEMAAVTPRKRNRSSTSSDSMFLALGTPAKKLMMDITVDLSPVKTSTNRTFASRTKWPPRFSDEDKENQASPLKSSMSRKLDNSPLQIANIPMTACREFLSKLFPKSGSPYKPIVPAASFYSKEKRYLTPLERKLVNESRPLSWRDNDGDLPTANRTEKVQGNMNLIRNTSSKTSKRQTGSRHTKILPRNSKKAKVDIAPVKPVVEKENIICPIEKKMEAPFRVLSMKVKPLLKLQMGAAFFSTGKKSHSGPKKLPSGLKSSQLLSSSAAEGDQLRLSGDTEFHSDDKNKVAKASEVSKCASVPQKKGNEDREEDREKLANNISQKKVIHKLKVSMQKVELIPFSGSDSSKPLTPEETDTRNLNSDDAGSSINHEFDYQENIPFSQSPIENNKVSPSADVVYPIFSTPSVNKARPQPFPDDLASPLGFSPPTKMVHTFQKTSKKTKDLSKDFKDQMIIDAGQKHFGAIICKSCGMIYTAASPEDEAQHIQHHQRFLEGIKYVGWKKEHVVAEFWDGKMVLVLPDDPKYAIKKAFRVLSEPNVPQSPNQDVLQHHRAWRCSIKPEAAICGISRIWVFSLMRRRGIARRMVDVVRNTFMYGCYLSTDEIAFSDPTPDGKLFATKYCQTPNFLVYNFIS
ncbi:N-acetyltransferase ESCO2 isoform X4 [Dermochelys coriacea]|uniref:N-acetyltransferase ESCO2 isoform X4 n=2 Tax=Dermochelys coriacea TaxID=27794 RepID=UPI001CA91371|nr:N-acetyltransferase ESCO2 isoform X4 [Dermochelys coriacea]